MGLALKHLVKRPIAIDANCWSLFQEITQITPFMNIDIIDIAALPLLQEQLFHVIKIFSADTQLMPWAR